jgi:hypothetical protein
MLGVTTPPNVPRLPVVSVIAVGCHADPGQIEGIPSPIDPVPSPQDHRLGAVVGHGGVVHLDISVDGAAKERVVEAGPVTD